MAGTLKVDSINADSNLALKIANTAVAFIDATGLRPVAGNLNLDATATSKLYLPSANTVAIQTAGVTAVTIDSSQNVTLAAALAVTGAATLSSSLGVTGVTTVQAGTAALPAITTSGDTNTGIFFPAADTIAFSEGGAESMRINSSGNVGVGVTTPSPWSLGKGLEVGFAGNGLNATRQAEFNINCNAYYDGTWRYGGTGKAFVIQVSDGTFNTLLSAASGSAGGEISWTTGPSITNDGHFSVAGGNSAWLTVNPNLGATEGTALGYFYGNGSGDMLFQSMNQGGGSGTNAGIKLGMNSTNSRSINARGTVNASGADYAEYMIKCSNFTVAKGDVVGINANGKLTNVFTDALSFVVKSTDPSYVGGDTWSSPEALGLAELRPLDQSASDEVKAKYAQDKAVMDTALETARQLVDRIAFSGQVPVNVTGATAGQYIIPVNDNGAIKGQAVSNPTFEQYQIAVGKVIAIESDGRAKIIVKVA